MYHTQAHKLLKPATVIHLEFQFLLTRHSLESLLQHYHLEYNDHINPLFSRRALPLFLKDTLQQWTEFLPWFCCCQTFQGGLLPPWPCQPLLLIPKTLLPHHCPTCPASISWQTSGQPTLQAIGKDR